MTRRAFAITVSLLPLVSCAAWKQERSFPNFLCPTAPIQFERRILGVINKDRQQRSLLAVRRDTLLTAAALSRAQALAELGRLDHKVGGGAAASLRSLGLRRQSLGENLARIVDQVETDQALLAFWMSRKTELNNIRSVQFQRAGLGVFRGKDGCYCVLLMTD